MAIMRLTRTRHIALAAQDRALAELIAGRTLGTGSRAIEVRGGADAENRIMPKKGGQPRGDRGFDASGCPSG